jgi:hypothetical protein
MTRAQKAARRERARVYSQRQAARRKAERARRRGERKGGGGRHEGLP